MRLPALSTFFPRSVLRCFRNSAVLLTLVLVAGTPALEAADTVTLQLRDDRKLVGVVDPKTDDEVLWIRIERERIALTTGVTWDLVAVVKSGERTYTAAEFREVADSFKRPAARASMVRDGATIVRQSSPAVVGQLPLREFVGGSVATRRVQYLQVEASVVNWDRDPEPDGIELRLLPRTSDGEVVAVQGAFSARLDGRILMVTRAHPSPPFPELERWAQTIRPSDFAGSAGARFRLPFQQLRGDSVLDLQSFGGLQVTLNASGHGEFQADVPVRLRTFHPLRDQEHNYDRRHDEFNRYRGRHW